MAVQGGEDVYATLLLNDAYLPGALVLAHSLRDAGTTKKLVVLVTLDTVSAEAITQLKSVYDHVIAVPRIRNERPANLYLMNRADLHSAFTKINLWKQTQFRKVVYIDADIVAYRAPDELFDLPHPFSAAPDIGWPDLFNTGVMALTPNMGDYYALMAMAERGISFDGADQGLLNMHFKNTYNRISFTYNVTPSAHYQYVPAYRHFQSSINMVHFIGPDKPWFQGRDASTGEGPYNEMSGRWWSVYDRHYRVASPATTRAESQQPVPELVQYLVKGEFQPKPPRIELTGELHHEEHGDHAQQHYYQSSHREQHHHDDQSSYGHVQKQPGAHSQPPEQSSPPSSVFLSSVEGAQAEACKEQVYETPSQAAPAPAPKREHKEEPFQPTSSSWDAQRSAPPADSKPEALNFPSTTYEMSKDPAPFVAPQRYPSPPKNMWYDVPKEAPAQKPRAIFPWETHQPRASRVFAEDPFKTETAATEGLSSPTGSSTVEHKSEPITPTTPTIHVTSSDPWSNFSRTNAWDDVPEIERYVDAVQQHRRKRSQGSRSGGLNLGTLPKPEEIGVVQRRGSKLTDFPSEVERPSLPVTPAPIRRPKFWGSGGPGVDDDDEEDGRRLPAAQGVPPQSDWDPVAQLQKLAKEQSELLLQKLGGVGTAEGRRDSSELPPRPVPFGSEELTSPTYVAQSAPVLSPRPVKGNASSSFRGILSEDGAGPRTIDISSSNDPAPSYGGPGAQYEKGEGISTRQTPALPTDEERDILET